MIHESNIHAFTQAALRRARELERSGDNDKRITGVLIEHTTNVIGMHVTAQRTPVDPANLSEIFRDGAVDITFGIQVALTSHEIKGIFLRM